MLIRYGSTVSFNDAISCPKPAFGNAQGANLDKVHVHVQSSTSYVIRSKVPAIGHVELDKSDACMK